MAFIGIDLGTTTSEAAVFNEREEEPQVLKDQRGDEIVDSYVGIDTKTNKIEVGEKVKSIFLSESDNAVEQVKRQMGENTEIVFGSSEGGTENQVLLPEEVSARILSHLKESAENQLDEEVDRCVITVPANFPDDARRATKQAGKIAGMTVERIINEPTAAALTYGYDEDIEKENVMVYDLGGGTFDVSVGKYRGNVLDIKGSSGDTDLGGKDFDEALLWHIAERFQDQHGISIEEGSRSYYRLLFKCEDAKKELSFNRRTSVQIPFFTTKNGEPIDLDVEVTRSTFEDLISEKVDKTKSSIENALEDGSFTPEDIDRVILVGGSTRIPYVQSHVEKVMGQAPQRRVDPDKTVALGAAVQSAIIDGEIDNVILDVCPLSLGTAAMEVKRGRREPGRYQEIIEPPAEILQPHRESFYTVHEAQDAIDFRVYQRDNGSDSEKAEINGKPNEEEGFHRLIGKMIDLPKSGKQEIEVKYVYNPDGVLEVTVSFPESNKSVEIEIDSIQGLSEEEIKRSRQKVKGKNFEERYEDSEYYKDVEPILARAEKELQEGSLGPEKQKEVRSLVRDMKRALAAENKEKVEVLEEELTEALFEVS